jgi:bacteriorhodopsin
MADGFEQVSASAPGATPKDQDVPGLKAELAALRSELRLMWHLIRVLAVLLAALALLVAGGPARYASYVVGAAAVVWFAVLMTRRTREN